MVTVTFETNKTYAKKLAEQLKADKRIKRVDLIDDDPIASHNLIRSGKLISDKDLERMVLQAESEPDGLPIDESYARVKRKFNSWKKKQSNLK